MNEQPASTSLATSKRALSSDDSTAVSESLFSNRRWFSSLAARVMHTVWLVPFVMVVGFFIAFQRMWETVHLEAAQRNNASLAKVLAAELQPYFSPVVDEQGARSLLYRYLLLNSMVDIYLLGEDGHVVERYSLQDALAKPAAVDLEPIQRFLAKGESKTIPLFGTDPVRPSVPTVFSVEPFMLRDQPGYLYVVLVNQLSRHAFSISLSSIGFRYGLAVILAISFFAIFSGELYIRRTFRRFDDIMTAVASFEAGEFSARGPEDGADELGRLGAAVNSMAQKIASNITELQNKDALRRELIANIWHDIKSPVAAVNVHIELLKSESQAEARDQIADKALVSVKMLSKVLEELRELGQFEANEIKPDLAPCSIVSLLDDIALAVAHHAEARGIAFVVNADTSLPAVRADETMIIRVLLNLVENAIRYTANGGRVEAFAALAEDGVKVTIRDSGSGISTADLPHIFERSFQSSGSPEVKHGSAGLGLAIVKKILELHGTSIAVRSELGSGTEFSFILPLAAQ